MPRNSLFSSNGKPGSFLGAAACTSVRAREVPVPRVRTSRFEPLEARLALSVNLGLAGAFQTVGGSTNSLYSGVHDLSRGGGLVTDGAGNSYVTINGGSDNTVDLDPDQA